jgi:PAS domain S-box-containing protein
MKWGRRSVNGFSTKPPELSSVKSPPTFFFLWNRQIFEQSRQTKAFPKAFAFGIKERKFPLTHRPSYEELEKRIEELEKEALMRNRAEEEALIDEARLRSLLRISQLKTASVRELLDSALHEAIALSESKLGCIYYYSEDRCEFTLHAWSKEVMKECTILNPPTVYQLEKTGIWGEAVRQRKPIVVNDFLAPNPLKKGYPEGHAQLFRYMTIPVFSGERIVGVVGVANKGTDYTGLDVRQLALMMDSVWKIAERREAEEALRESQQMLHLVLDTIPVRVFWKDLDSNYLGCNRPFALDAGLQSPEEILGRNDSEMGWREQAQLYRSDDRLVIETGRPKLGYEEPQTTPSGDRIWLRTSKVPLFDVKGEIKGVLGTYEDITVHKRAEEMLRASETRYRIVADNTYDWEYWSSPEGQVLYASPSCQRITGYTVSEFEADPKLASRIVHPDDLTQFEAHVVEARTKSAASSSLEFRILHRDGTTRWIAHVCQPVFDGRGYFLGRRGSNRDITDRKKAEKALEESSQKLKFFAYSVAHDLKSPATGVYGLTKRLSKHARDVLDEKGRTYCDQIMKVSEHIAALVEKINMYIATKESALLIETINISEIVRMLRDEFSTQLSLRRIDWLAPESEVEIKADRLSILRIFRNLIDNALKYGGESLTRISIGYEDSESLHIFSVSDNGKGLKEADSEKIFGLFQRNETSRGVEGAGLGLAIVKEIAEQHGGRVWVEPRGKKGITFYVSISKNL